MGIFTNHLMKNKKEPWGAANSPLPLHKISCRLRLRNVAIKGRERAEQKEGWKQFCYRPPASWDEWLDTEAWREQLLGGGVEDYSSASAQREAQSEVDLAFLSLMPIHFFALTWHAIAPTGYSISSSESASVVGRPASVFSAIAPFPSSIQCHFSFVFSLYILSPGHTLYLLGIHPVSSAPTLSCIFWNLPCFLVASLLLICLLL